jgi:hypothetical protein
MTNNGKITVSGHRSMSETGRRQKLTMDLFHLSALEKVSCCVKCVDGDADQTLALSQAVITIAVAR